MPLDPLTGRSARGRLPAAPGGTPARGRAPRPSRAAAGGARRTPAHTARPPRSPRTRARACRATGRMTGEKFATTLDIAPVFKSFASIAVRSTRSWASGPTRPERSALREDSLGAPDLVPPLPRASSPCRERRLRMPRGVDRETAPWRPTMKTIQLSPPSPFSRQGEGAGRQRGMRSRARRAARDEVSRTLPPALTRGERAGRPRPQTARDPPRARRSLLRPRFQRGPGSAPEPGTPPATSARGPGPRRRSAPPRAK
jgi:hypothetical protein